MENQNQQQKGQGKARKITCSSLGEQPAQMGIGQQVQKGGFKKEQTRKGQKGKITDYVGKYIKGFAKKKTKRITNRC